MNSQLHYEALRSARPEPRYIEGWPPPQTQAPPGRKIRRSTAVRLVRIARRIDDTAAWRAFAP